MEEPILFVIAIEIVFSILLMVGLTKLVLSKLESIENKIIDYIKYFGNKDTKEDK